jgi:RNA polymerase sigma factor (sigma-70 family)
VADLESLSDDELLAQTADTPEAFGVFYERHVQAILDYLQRRTGDTEVGLDLTAEVFAAALVGSRRFKPGKVPAIGWLYGIANKKLARSRRRQAIDMTARRKLGIRRLEFSDEALERVEDLIDAGESDYLSGMEKLSPGERMAVKARVIDERDYADIAAAENATETTIRKRVSRGLDKLADFGRREA